MEIVKQGIEASKAEHATYVIIDTAGRLHIDEQLMHELQDIRIVLTQMRFCLSLME